MVTLDLSDTQILPSGLRFSAEDGVLLAQASRLKLDPNQPRLNVDADELQALRKDIDTWRSDGHGLLGSGIMEPFKCRWEPGAVNGDGSVRKNAKLLVWDGGRRWRVTHEDYDWLPIILDDLDSKSARSAALRTSIHNKAHSPIEQAHAFEAEMRDEKLTLRDMARKYSVDKSYVENRLNLLKCPTDVQQFASKNPGMMSHALAMRNVTDKSLRGELMALAEHGASVQEIIEVIRDEAEKKELLIESYTAPDAETQARSNLHQRTGGGNVSRGRVVTTVSIRDAGKQIDEAAAEMEHRMKHIADWWAALPAAQRKTQRRRLLRIARQIDQLEEV